jgi:hypothetical protein
LLAPELSKKIEILPGDHLPENYTTGEQEDQSRDDYVAKEAYDLLRDLNWKMVRDLRSLTKNSKNLKN